MKKNYYLQYLSVGSAVPSFPIDSTLAAILSALYAILAELLWCICEKENAAYARKALVSMRFIVDACPIFPRAVSYG